MQHAPPCLTGADMFSILRAATLVAALGSAAMAGATVPFDVLYESEAPGLQNTTATFSVGGVETFESVPTRLLRASPPTSAPAARSAGSYSNVQINKADQYGGAGGTGKYAVTFAVDRLLARSVVDDPRRGQLFRLLAVGARRREPGQLLQQGQAALHVQAGRRYRRGQQPPEPGRVLRQPEHRVQGSGQPRTVHLP